MVLISSEQPFSSQGARSLGCGTAIRYSPQAPCNMSSPLSSYRISPRCQGSSLSGLVIFQLVLERIPIHTNLKCPLTTQTWSFSPFRQYSGQTTLVRRDTIYIEESQALVKHSPSSIENLWAAGTAN